MNYLKYSNNEFYCNTCNQEKTLINSEASYVCQKCGNASFIIIDSERPSYKEPPSEISYFAYKRINHFNEFSKSLLITASYLNITVLYLGQIVGNAVFYNFYRIPNWLVGIDEYTRLVIYIWQNTLRFGKTIKL